MKQFDLTIDIDMNDAHFFYIVLYHISERRYDRPIFFF